MKKLLLPLCLLLLIPLVLAAPPVVDTVVDQTAIQETLFTLTLTATDVDGDQNLVIDAGQSVIPSFLQSDTLTISGRPTFPDIGEYDVSVVVIDDNNEASEAVEFTLTVLPGLQINDVQYTVNGVSTSATELSPGDEVTVSFTFRNNLDRDLTLGHIETHATGSVSLTGMPHDGVCVGVDCERGYWALQAGESGSDSFSFTVPYNINEDDFTVDINVDYDLIFFPTVYEDAVSLDFSVIREFAATVIEDAALEDTTLFCTRTAQLDLTVVNVGDATITPEVLIYEKNPVRTSFDPETGEFTQFTGGQPLVFTEVTLASLDPTESSTTRIPVDLLGLSPGQHTLYVFVVNPYFDSEDYFVGDEAVVTVTIGNCLDTEALAEVFTIAKDSNTATSAVLADYILEDNPEDYEFTFSILEESNTDLISCDVTNGQLTCDQPSRGGHGVSTLTVEINEAEALSPFDESFAVTITPTLEITNVQLNGIAVAENGNSPSVRPQQAATITFTITNNLPHAVTGVGFGLSGPLDAETVEGLNLVAGGSSQVTIAATVPHTLPAGNYLVEITGIGLDFENNQNLQIDQFDFTLVVSQQSAEVVISELTAATSALTCSASTTVSVEITNNGRSQENDVVLTLFNGATQIATEDIVIAANTQQTFTFPILGQDLSEGANTLTATVSYRNGFVQNTATTTLTKSACLTSFTPAGSTVVVKSGQVQAFSVTLAEEGFAGQVVWSLDNQVVSRGTLAYNFQRSVVGTYTLTATVGGETRTWEITVTNKPVSQTFTTNIPETVTEAQLRAFPSFTVENAFGKIVFSQPVDLSNVANLDAVLRISANEVALDAVAAPGLNVPATVTLKRTFTDHVVLRADAFVNGDFVTCVTRCQVVSNQAGQFVFTVTGWSAYRVQERQPANLVISEILFANAQRGTTVTTTFTLQNTGTFDSITNIAVDTTAIPARYTPIVTNAPSTLNPGESREVTLQLSIPQNDVGGRITVGSLKVTATGLSKTAPVVIDSDSFLKIKKVEINGKTSGDFKIDDVNEIEVTVQNDYTEDMEDVTVEVRILDVDGDDLEENEDIGDLRKNKDDKVTLEFDLADELLDEEEYIIEIIVEGEADDGTTHRTIKQQKVDLDIDNHKVVLQRAALSQNILQCQTQATLDVLVKNLGKNDEEVDIFVRNTVLGLDLNKQGIDINEFIDDDNDHRELFTINVANAQPGSYPIVVDVDRDGKREVSETVTLVIQECLTSGNIATSQPGLTGDADVARDLQRQLEAGLRARQAEAPVSSFTSIRDSSTYTVMLAILVGLILIALVLAAVVLLTKRK